MLLAGLIAWEAAARLGWVAAIFFPPPSLIVLTLVDMVRTATFWSALGITLLRLVGGVVIGASTALLLGWVMGTVRGVRITVEPLVALLHPLPKLALFPLFLILLGIGEASKVAVVAVTAFFPVLINTLAGVDQIEQSAWEVAAIYGAGRSLRLRRLIIPGTLPLALVGVRLALNNGLILTVAVEMLAAQHGLGVQIWLAWQTFRIADLYATLVVIALLGYGGNWWMGSLTRRLTPWQGRFVQ